MSPGHFLALKIQTSSTCCPLGPGHHAVRQLEQPLLEARWEEVRPLSCELHLNELPDNGSPLGSRPCRTRWAAPDDALFISLLWALPNLQIRKECKGLLLQITKSEVVYYTAVGKYSNGDWAESGMETIFLNASLCQTIFSWQTLCLMEPRNLN